MGITTVTPDNYTNYGSSTLASGITSGQTTLPLHSGDGAKFPTIYPFVVAINAAGSGPELCSVSNNSSDTLTVTRGVESTSGNQIAWASGTTVDLIVSAAEMGNIWTVLSALNTKALPNDNSDITTDGSGDITTIGNFTSSNGTTAFQFGNSGHYSQLNTDQGGNIELGSHNSVSPGGAQTPYIDFHSSNNAVDYDVRMQASSGSSSAGQGTLTITANGGITLTASSGVSTSAGFSAGTTITVGTTLSVTGAISKVNNVSTAGAYGVPICLGVVRDFVVSNTTNTDVLNVTLPNDGINHLVYCHAEFYVGGGNTNAGTCSLNVSYTDPNAGALTLYFTVYNTTSLVQSFSQAKGNGVRTYPRTIYCSPNTTVQIYYQNSSAGTISDHVNAVTILMA